MKSKRLVAVPLAAALMAAGPELPAARAAAGVYHSRMGSPITGLPLNGWAGVPLLRTGQNLRVQEMGLGRSIPGLLVAPAPGVKAGPTIEARQASPGLFAAAALLSERLAQDAGLLALRDARLADSQLLSVVNRIFDDSRAPRDAYGVFTMTPRRLTLSQNLPRARFEGGQRLFRLAEDQDGSSGRAPVEKWKGGARKRRGEVGRGLALFAGGAAALSAGLHGLSFSMPRLLPLLGQGLLCMLTVAGAAGVVAALVVGGNRLRSHLDGYRKFKRRDAASWAAGLLASSAALGGGLYGLRVWAPQYLPVFAKFGLLLLTAAGAAAVFFTLLAACERLKERVKDRRATEPRGERPERDGAPKAEKPDGGSGARVDWKGIGRWTAALTALAAGLGGVVYGLDFLLPGSAKALAVFALGLLGLLGAGALVWLAVAAHAWLQDRFRDRD